MQVLALAYYAISYFPGGAAGLKFLSSTLTSTILRCFGRWSCCRYKICLQHPSRLVRGWSGRVYWHSNL